MNFGLVGRWIGMAVLASVTFTPLFASPVRTIQPLSSKRSHFLENAPLSSVAVTVMVVNENVPPAIPNRYSIAQNYPNPFNSSTIIKYSIPERVHVTVDVFNVLGKRVAMLVDAVQPPGYYSCEWNGDVQSSGIYFYRLNAGAFQQSRRLVLLR